MSDLISRQAAIDAIQNAYCDTEGGEDKCAVWKNVGLTEALHIMQDLPSAFSEYMNEPKISEDGTLVVNVPDASAVGRVLVGDNRNVGGLYYPSDEGSEPKWIEIYEGQENLPPLGIDILLYVINGSMAVGYLMKDEEGLKWKVGTWYNDFLEWDAWRYLPEPYEYPPKDFMNQPEGSEE